MNSFKKFCFILVIIHVISICSSIAMSVEALKGVNKNFCFLGHNNIRIYLQIAIIITNILGSLIMCISTGYLLTHISECPIANPNFLPFPLPRTPPPPRPPLPPKRYDPPVTRGRNSYVS